MRRAAWGFLLLFAFAVPWEYSLDLGEPLGNIARIIGLLLLLLAFPSLLQAGRMRFPGPLQWVVLALFLWFCCTCFWTIEPQATLTKIRGFAQEMIVVWLVWEFVESPEHLGSLLRAYVAGSCLLAVLTVVNVASMAASGEIRFAAPGQDPNDVARFLDLGFPMAALLLNDKKRWASRALAIGYLPVGLLGVLLTASRSGFIAALVALAGCGLLMLRRHRMVLLAGVFAMPILVAGLWLTVGRETLLRIATIPEQLQGGDLNQRLNIWDAGWRAFAHAPLLGTGIGSFVSAAGLAPTDTAHNTALALLVEGGIVALLLASAVVALSARAIMKARGDARLAMGTALLVWVVTSLVATVEENRTTWLLLGIISVAGRLATEEDRTLCHTLVTTDGVSGRLSSGLD
jgi:O-antigen ligase